MRDIRQKGRYELHEALTNQAATIQLSKLAIESEREISAKALADAAANQLALEKVQAMADAAAAELERFRTKKYEEIPKYDHVYINKEVAELHSDRHKLGKAMARWVTIGSSPTRPRSTSSATSCRRKRRTCARHARSCPRRGAAHCITGATGARSM